MLLFVSFYNSFETSRRASIVIVQDIKMMEFEETFLIQQEKTRSYLKVANNLEKLICENG